MPCTLQTSWKHSGGNVQKYGIAPTYISSGFYYDYDKVAKVRKEKSFLGVPVYTIVNSPILAPSGFPERMYREALTDVSLTDVFRKFLYETGPYDVVHFNSLEGLTPQILALKQEFPQTKFIHSIHDYGAFCPRVQFWSKTDLNCVQHPNENKCSICMKDFQAIPSLFTKRLRPSTFDDNSSHWMQRQICRVLGKTKVMSLFSCNDENVYKEFRETYVGNINKYVDSELVVSKCVGDIAEKYGIRHNLIRLSYIGTKVADNALMHNRNDSTKDIFTILYMGYMSKMKGFYFYLSALDKIDEKIASAIDLKFATRITDRQAYEHALSLKEKFHDVIFYDGYAHDDFPKIMQDVNLGIVPPLWEDNLPQVTIEMIANGIPVLTSSHGGAKELNCHPDFSFSDEMDLISKIQKIAQNRTLLEDYWKCSVSLTTMRQHVEQLIQIYKS